MVYRDKIEVIISLKEDQDPEEVLPLIEAAGVENCKVSGALRMIIGYIATLNTTERHNIYVSLKAMPEVQDISSAVIHTVLKE